MVRRNNRVARSKRRFRRRFNGNSIIESMVSDVTYGTSSAIVGKHLSNVPKHSIWRPAYAIVQATGPGAIQVCMCSPSGTVLSSSPVQLLGSQTKKVRVAYPRSAEWFVPLDESTPSQVMIVNSICVGTDTTIKLKVSCVVTMKILLKNEIVAVTCPVQMEPIDLALGSPFSSIGN